MTWTIPSHLPTIHQVIILLAQFLLFPTLTAMGDTDGPVMASQGILLLSQHHLLILLPGMIKQVFKIYLILQGAFLVLNILCLAILLYDQDFSKKVGIVSPKKFLKGFPLLHLIFLSISNQPTFNGMVLVFIFFMRTNTTRKVFTSRVRLGSC